MATKNIRFALTKDSGTLFIFYRDDETKIEFADVLRSGFREFQTVDAPIHYRLFSKHFSPPIKLTLEDHIVIESTDGASSSCYNWKSQECNYTVVSRRPDCVIGNFHAFHLYRRKRRVAYWDQPKRYGHIRGIYSAATPSIDVAVIAFCTMYDWDSGRNWSQ